MVSIQIDERWKPSQSLSLIDDIIIIKVNKVKMKTLVVVPLNIVDYFRYILQLMLEKEDIQERMFLKMKKEDFLKHINAGQMARPTTQINHPFFDRLLNKVQMRMNETSKNMQIIANRLSKQSKETGKQLIFNHLAASNFIFQKFQKACSRGVSLSSQHPESDQINNDDQKIKSIITELRNCSSLLEQHRQIYAKIYLIHNHKCAKYFSNHFELFKSLTDNLEILMEWLEQNNIDEQYRQKLDHVLPFKLIKTKLQNNQVQKEENKWTLKHYKQAFVMIMDRGDNCLESSSIDIHIHNKKNPFQINNYLQYKEDQDVLDYFLQVCRALAELIQHKIYHMDMEPKNIIPMKDYKGQINYKIIDFEMALFLDKTVPKVHQSLVEVWRQTAACWKNDQLIVSTLFHQLLCRKYDIISHKFDKIKRAPGNDLYEYLFVCQTNAEEFIDYLLTYMECYYRNALLQILILIIEGRKWFTDHQERLEGIIMFKRFQDIAQSIQSLWDNHF